MGHSKGAEGCSNSCVGRLTRTIEQFEGTSVDVASGPLLPLTFQWAESLISASCRPISREVTCYVMNMNCVFGNRYTKFSVNTFSLYVSMQVSIQYLNSWWQHHRQKANGTLINQQQPLSNQIWVQWIIWWRACMSLIHIKESQTIHLVQQREVGGGVGGGILNFPQADKSD